MTLLVLTEPLWWRLTEAATCLIHTPHPKYLPRTGTQLYAMELKLRMVLKETGMW